MIFTTLLLVLGQASQPNEWSTFPPAGSGKQPAAKSEPKAEPKTEPKADAKAAAPDDAAKAKYKDAVDKISHSDFGGATAVLNQLAGQYPKWASVFSARCIAQAGLKYPQYAVEDCTYALTLDPDAPSPLWWLASSEEALGRKADAAKHYQRYADLRTGDVSPTYRELALKKAKELGGGGDGAAAADPKKVDAPPAKTEPAKTPDAGKKAEPAAKTDAKTANGKSDNTPVTSPSSWNSMPATAAACNASGECHNGQQCKDRGDGTKMCMGNGKNGAFCANSKDCVFPGKCKHRNDGVNVCMGGGGQGAFCDEGSDCTGGLWCRDRGDGVKTCATK